MYDVRKLAKYVNQDSRFPAEIPKYCIRRSKARKKKARWAATKMMQMRSCDCEDEICEDNIRHEVQETESQIKSTSIEERAWNITNAPCPKGKSSGIQRESIDQGPGHPPRESCVELPRIADDGRQRWLAQKDKHQGRVLCGRWFTHR